MRASVGVFTPKLTIETNTERVTIITVAGITAEACLVLLESLPRFVCYCRHHCRGLFVATRNREYSNWSIEEPLLLPSRNQVHKTFTP